MGASPKGPLVYETWKALSVRSETASGSYEVRLYTDAPIEEFYQREYGPYLFIHTGHPEVEGPQCVPALVLRMPDISNSIAGLSMTSNLVFHEPWEKETNDRPAVAPPDIQSDMNRYHAGVLHDEVAALTSLALGIRLKASGSVRRFDQYTGAKGRPTYQHDLSTPNYARKFSNYVIPDAVTPRDFAPELLNVIPTLEPQAAIALIKAARRYQQGLWLSESDPEETWEKFVDAVEAAAEYWNEDVGRSVDWLRGAKDMQEFVKLLEEAGGEALLSQAADLIAPRLRVTARFIGFILHYLPPAPAQRPGREGQVPWSKTKLRDPLSMIYDYRSRSHHGGQAFPLPMCRPPERRDGWKAPAEKTLYLSTEHPTAVWRAEATPLSLHMFAYLVRGSLCNWWQKGCPKRCV
jgi:hypothetical protein